MDGVFDRRGLEILDIDEAMELVASLPVGRIAFPHDGEAFVAPVNHRVVGRSIVFRTGAGTTFGAAWSERPATFHVDDYEVGSRTGWSVVVRGTAYVVEHPGDIAALEALDLDSWVIDPSAEHSWIRVVPNAVTGRRIVRSDVVGAPSS